MEDGEANITNFEYDGEGNRTAQVEPKGPSYRTEFDYGELNELIEVRMPDGGVYTYAYDENRNRTGQTDAEGNVVTFIYDVLNRVDLMIQDPEGFALTTDHDYDANGNETKLTDPKGQVIDFEYDVLNRLQKKTYNLTADDFALFTRTHEITFFYDANDNLEQIEELKSTGTDAPAVESSFKTFDDLDRMESETDVFARTLAYDYDPQGNRTLLIDPDGKRTAYNYDELNRLETLTLDETTPSVQVVTYDYFPNGLKKTVTNPNSTLSTFQYDRAARMTSISHTGPFGVVSSYLYDYDQNGNRRQQIETNAGRTETTTYDYDLVNRLNIVTYELGAATANQATYTYDLVGNRLTEREVHLATSVVTKDLTYDYDAIDRLDTITDNLGTGNDVNYAYDPNGNTLTKAKNGTRTSFLYDIRNRLSEVRQDASVLGRYAYDSEGLRILKIGDDGIRTYTYVKWTPFFRPGVKVVKQACSMKKGAEKSEEKSHEAQPCFQGESCLGGTTRAGDSGGTIPAAQGSREPDLQVEAAAFGERRACFRDRRGGRRRCLDARGRTAPENRGADDGARFFITRARSIAMTPRRELVEPNAPLSMRWQCELLGVNRSSLYYEPVEPDGEQLALMRRMDELHLKHPFFGSRMMTQILKAEGSAVNRKRVQRLMRLMGLESTAPKPNTSKPAPEHTVYPYLLRNLTVSRINQVWAAQAVREGE